MDVSRTASELTLACQPSKVGNRLIFSYRVTNTGDGDAFIMDALAGADAVARKTEPTRQWAVVMAGPGDDATLGRIIPPPPTDRRIAMPVIPLARRLGRGEALEGVIDIPVPLAETSPYFADLSLRRYEIVEIKAIVLKIGYWEAGRDGFASIPMHHAPAFHTVVTRETVGSARQLSIRLSTRGLQLFKRLDAFPRVVDAADVPAMRARAEVDGSLSVA